MTATVTPISPRFTMGTDVSEEDFWNARPLLTHLRTAARARRSGPWVVLGWTLMRAVAAIEPYVVLPPLVGGEASLNLLLALVARSGGGKGGAGPVSRRAVSFRTPGRTLALEAPELPIGSGEGIARTFAPPKARKDEDEPPAPLTSALFTSSEIDAVKAICERQGSTLESTMRQVFSGEQLGAANAGENTRVIIPAHSYRASVAIAVQPLRARALLDGSGGGTPQRFLWLPTTDSGAEENWVPEWPGNFDVDVPSFRPDIETRFSEIGIPEHAAAEIDHAAYLRVSGAELGEALDGHRLLCQEKVAAALMIADGRFRMNSDDWELAKFMMYVSDCTRNSVVAEVKRSAKMENLAKAIARAETEEARDNHVVKKTKMRILTVLQDRGTLNRSTLRKCINAVQRPHFDPAIEDLVSAGEVFETSEGYSLEAFGF